MSEFLQDIEKASASKFEEDVRYLKKIFDEVECIEGCVVRIIGNEGKDNYSRSFGNPLEERTLKIVSAGGSDIILFYKHSVKGFQKVDVCKGVTIVESFSFSNKYKVESYWHKPAEVPNYLESYITECISNAMSKLRLYNDNFLERNFERGEMMPLTDMKKHPEWQTKYIGEIDTKDVNMCKSCGCRAYKGCCQPKTEKR